MLKWVPRWLRRTFAAIVLGLVVWFFVIPQFGAASEAIDALRGIQPLGIAGAVTLVAASFSAQAEMTRRVMPRAERPSLFDMVRIELAAAAVSHTVPGGTAAGTALGFRLLRQAGASGASAAFAAGVRGIGSTLVLNVMLWLALVAWIPLNGFSSRYLLAAGVGVVVLGIALVLTITLVKAPARARSVLTAIADRIPLLDGDRVGGAVERVSDQLGDLLGDRRLAARVVAWSSVYWLAQAAALWLLLDAFGWRANVVAVLVAFGLVNVLAAIPVTPRGLGVLEAVLIPTLVGFGSPAHIATLGVISWRLLTFWAPIPLGALSYVSILLHQPDVGDDRDAVRRRAERELAEARHG